MVTTVQSRDTLKPNETGEKLVSKSTESSSDVAFFTAQELELGKDLRIPPVSSNSRYARTTVDISPQMDALLSDIPRGQRSVFGSDNLLCAGRGIKSQHVALTKLDNGSYLVTNLTEKDSVSMKTASGQQKEIEPGPSYVVHAGTEVTIGSINRLKFALPAFEHPVWDSATVDFAPAIPATTSGEAPETSSSLISRAFKMLFGR